MNKSNLIPLQMQDRYLNKHPEWWRGQGTFYVVEGFCSKPFKNIFVVLLELLHFPTNFLKYVIPSAYFPWKDP